MAVTQESAVARIEYLVPMMLRALDLARAGEPFAYIWPELDGAARRARSLCDDILTHMAELARIELAEQPLFDSAKLDGEA